MRPERSNACIKWQFKAFTELDNEGICKFRKGNIQAALHFLLYFQIYIIALCKLLCSMNRQERKVISVSFLSQEEF